MTIDAREHGLDAARAIAMVLVVAVHASISFMTTPIGWVIQDRSFSEAADLFVWIGHAFLMPVFFWLAGYWARVVVARDGIAGFVRARIVRVVVPLAIAIVPCSLALHAMWDWVEHRRATIAVATLESPGLPIGLGHLWYLYYLAIVSALAIVATRVRIPRRAALAGALATPIAVMCAVGKLQLDTPQRFAIDPAVLAFHGAFFAWGWLTPDVAGLARRARLATLVAIALVAALVPTLIASADGGALPLVAAAAAGLLSIALVAAFVGACVRHASLPSPWIRFASDAAYWSYIVHLPIVVLLQIALADVALPGPIKLLAILGTTLAVCFASYAGVVRRTPLRQLVG